MIDIIITHHNIIIKSTTTIIKQDIQFIKENELGTKNNYISFIVSICGLQDILFYNSTLNKTLKKQTLSIIDAYMFVLSHIRLIFDVIKHINNTISHLKTLNDYCSNNLITFD